MKKNNGFIAIGLILVVLVGVVGFLGYQMLYKVIPVEEKGSVSTDDNFSKDYKTLDDKGTVVNTADWKTYRSEKNTLSFKYLTQWGSILEHDEGSNSHVIRIATDNNGSKCSPINTPKCKTNPDIEIFLNKDKDVFEYYENIFNDGNLQVTRRDRKSLVVDGYSASLYIYTSPMNDPENSIVPLGYFTDVTAVFQKNSTDFVIIHFMGPIFQTKEEAYSYKTEDFVNFLSTIRFVDNASNNTNYTNKRYGYQVNLTDSWKDNKIVENSDGSVDFKVKTLSGAGEYWTLWHIVVEDVKAWDRDVQECENTRKQSQISLDATVEWESKCSFMSSKIGRNDKYVFMAISAQDFDGKDQVLHDDFRYKIIPTFKFTK